MKHLNRSFEMLVGLCVVAFTCPTARGQYQTNINPPSQLPANTPAAYNLIVPVVGQQESEWCWATCGEMTDNYADPLPVVQQCQEANAMFNPNGPEPQPGWSDCCVNPSSGACNVGDGGSSSQFPFDYYGNSTGTTLTWDQLRYQIWVINEPFAFGWNWCPCPPPPNCSATSSCPGSHIQVVTGYETDDQGNQWVYVNNPEPVGQGDFECMSYGEWSQDTSNGDPFGSHTHEGDWFDTTYGPGNQLIYNLATNGVVPVTALTEAEAPNLAGTVISDRMVPFTATGLLAVSGTIQERVVREDASQTLDFYYRVINSSSSGGNITTLTIQNFGRATVAVAYRPDSLGALPALQASRDISGSNLEVYLEPIPPGESSHFILLMTDATASNDQGTMGIGATIPLLWGLGESTQISTDQPTAVSLTAASMSPCPVMTQPMSQVVQEIESRPSEPIEGLPRRLGTETYDVARAAARAALPRQLSIGTVGLPIQLAEVPLDRLATYEQGQRITSLLLASTGLIVPVHFAKDDYLGVFLQGSDSHYVPVGMGQPNITRLLVHAMEAAAKQHNVPVESLTVLRVPGLFLTFIARSGDGKILLTPVSDEPSYDLRSGLEVSAEATFSRLRPAAEHHHASDLSLGRKRPQR